MKPSQSFVDIDELTEGPGPDLVPRVFAGWEESESRGAFARFRESCSELFEWLDPLEAEIVRMFLARERTTLAAARAFDEAGKGALYPILAAVAILVDGQKAFTIILACALATALSQAVYPALKQIVRRERPMAFDSELGGGVTPMDRYSWPSGHSITAVAFLVPFGVAGSGLVALIAPLVLLVLWSRLALGHHYPSDVAGGAIVGSVIALGASLLLRV